MKRWYVASTRPRQEIRAIENLARQELRAWLPRLRKSIRHARTIKSVLTPLFPGYVFVEMDLICDNWRSINGTFGIARLLTGTTGQPTPLPEGFVGSLLARTDNAGCLAPDTSTLLPGCDIKVIEGAMVGAVGKLLALNTRQRVTVLLEILGSEVRSSLPASALIATT